MFGLLDEEKISLNDCLLALGANDDITVTPSEQLSE